MIEIRLLRQMLRYYGIGDAQILSGDVAENGLTYRWIRRADSRADQVIEAQNEAALRAKVLDAVKFVKEVCGIRICRDESIAPRDIFYAENVEAGTNSFGQLAVVYVGRDVDVEALAFDLRCDEDDVEFLKNVHVAL